MFSTLGLFAATACADPACRRVSCPLSHTGAGGASGASSQAADARRLLGFGPAERARAAGGGEEGGSRKREAAGDGAGQQQQQQRTVKARVGGGPTDLSTTGSSNSSSAAAPRPTKRKAPASGETTIASLRAQVKTAAPPPPPAAATTTSTRDGSAAASSRPPNAAASSSRTPAAPQPKSIFTQKPAPVGILGRAAVAAGSSASARTKPPPPPLSSSSSSLARRSSVPAGTSSTTASSSSRPSTSADPARSHLILTTARSSGSLAPASKRASETRPTSRPAPPKRNRPEPDAPRLSLLPSQTTVPLKQRNKGLDALFRAFLQLYAPLEEAESWEGVCILAVDDALGQEAEAYQRGGKMGYHSAVSNLVTALRKRPAPTSVSHPSVGLQSAYIQSLADLTEAAASRLTAPIVAALVHPRAELGRYGYLLAVPDVEGGQRPTDEGRLRKCDRCAVEYIVGEEGDAKCWYHWGRARYGKDQGIRTQMATCCGVPWTHQGCTTSAFHVFKETDPLDLHQRAAFVSTADLPAPAAPTRLDVVGLDCEMLYTTGGLTLARITVVDEDGKALFDELVRPDPARVLDHNTRFSGIKPGEVENAAMDLEHVRAALGTLIGPETAIIGHGLENDLNALRLVHGKVIDTALLFPHPSGPPFRLALRDLMMTHLQRVIQNAGATGEGHSSLEDAAGSVELVRQRAKEMRERQGKLAGGA